METPELLFGIPMLVIGAVGVLVAIEMLFVGEGPRSKAEAAVRAGIMAFIALAAATVGEYFIAVRMEQAMVLLIIIAFFKAGVIIQFFMHVMRVRHAHEEES
jgi:uncharacterized membrane protein